jgi:hypothetical protein
MVFISKAFWVLAKDRAENSSFALTRLAHTPGNVADGKYFLFSGCEGCDCNLWAMRGTGSGLRISLRAVARGRKAAKSSPDPADLFTNRFSNNCARVEARIFDKKHAIFLFAQSRHDRASEG